MSGSPGEALRILFVCHFYPPHVGGIENVVHQEATRLAAAGAQVVVLTSGESGSLTVEEGVTVLRVRAWNGLEQRAGVPFPVFGPALMAHALRWTRWADVMHVHDSFYLTSWAGWLASVLTRTPMVMTQHVAMVEHSSGAVRLVQRLVYATAGRLLMRRARMVFTMNTEVAAFADGLGAHPEAVRHLPNGVDTEVFRPVRDDAERARERERLGLPADGVLVLFVGRFVQKKGFDLLLEAADPAYLLVFAGSGDDTALKARSDVRLLGSLTPDEVAAAYRACDVFALPSAAEGFPLTVQEAMSSGLAVVTSDDPGYAAYGLDRDRVSLVRRDVSALHTKLTGIALDAGLREDMGRYARAYAEKRFAWPEHVATLSEAYRSVCGRR